MRAQLQNKRLVANSEIQQEQLPNSLGQQLFCLAEWTDKNSCQISWQWESVTKYFQSFYQQDEHKLQNFLEHIIIAGFVGTRDSIVKFLDSKAFNFRGSIFKPCDLLKLKNEGIYVLKLKHGENQSYLIVWPGQARYYQSSQTKQFTKIVQNLCGNVVLVLGIGDEMNVINLQKVYQQTHTYPHRCDQGEISIVKDIKIFRTASIVVKQAVSQTKILDSNALVLEMLQQICGNNVSVQFSEEFWMPVREYFDSKEQEMPYGQLMILCNLLPKHGLQLHATMMDNLQSLVETQINIIEQKLNANYQTSSYICKIGSVEYNTETQNTKMEISQIVSQYYSIIPTKDLDQFEILNVGFDLQEKFWIKNVRFGVFSNGKNSTRIIMGDEEIWNDENLYKFAVYSDWQNIIVLYNAQKKQLVVLKVVQGLISGKWNIEKQQKLNKAISVCISQLADPVLSLQVICNARVKIPHLLIQTRNEIIMGNLINNSKEETYDNPELLRCKALLATERGTLIGMFFDAGKWLVNIWSLTSSDLELIAKCENIPIPCDLQNQDTCFTTYLDVDADKQYLIAVNSSASHTVTFVKFEINEMPILNKLYDALPWDKPNQCQIIVTGEHKELKKVIGNAACKFSFSLWEQWSMRQIQSQPQELQTILLNCPLTPLQDEIIQSTSIRELQEGDSVWYFSDDKKWIPSEVCKSVLAQGGSYTVKVGSGEVIAGREILRRRYSRHNLSINSQANHIQAFASYAELISLSLDSGSINKEKVLSSTVRIFEEVFKHCCKGNLAYDCMPYLYEPFRQVAFNKDQKMQKELMEMLDIYPVYLECSKIPTFQPAIDHLEMILKLYETFMFENYSISQSLDATADINNINHICNQCFQLVDKTKSFFQQNSNYQAAKSIENMYGQLIGVAKMIKIYLEKAVQKYDQYKQEVGNQIQNQSINEDTRGSYGIVDRKDKDDVVMSGSESDCMDVQEDNKNIPPYLL